MPPALCLLLTWDDAASLVAPNSAPRPLKANWCVEAWPTFFLKVVSHGGVILASRGYSLVGPAPPRRSYHNGSVNKFGGSLPSTVRPPLICHDSCRYPYSITN
ncbi:hypothetical protein Salat_0727200 [Sesamum alatum]|uniref:Uncharacterized protein n=1 Tax=Sesamum alatum TaxID=300844 RepID=A0AAE1YT59_9LAMI|nr:hypothetical protein Salat_0727200 [Sesamum alatum]